MKTCASLKFILLLIAVSIGGESAGQDNRAARHAGPLAGTPYSAFAGYEQTSGGRGVSCISIVQYVLTKMGYRCSTPDFKNYFNALIGQAGELELGRTGISEEGTILFNKFHFVLFNSDENANGVIDEIDTIAHARFEPLKIEPLSAWLRDDPARPVYAVTLSSEFVCP